MWGILLCTIGVAAITSRFKRGSAEVELGEPQAIESIRVRLPRGWQISDDGVDALRANERIDRMFQRVIVVRERDPENMTLLERFMNGATSTTAPARRGGKSPVIRLGPVDGVLTISREVLGEAGQRQVRNLQIRAMATLPNQHILTITLTAVDVDGEREPGAIELVKQIAGSVEYVPEESRN